MKRILLVLTVTAIAFVARTAFSQGTAFTYQGRLNNGTNPATGLYDLRFGIYDNSTAGSLQGFFLTNNATGVTNGLFTVTLDFGNQFPGDPRWLEVAVRTNGIGAFNTLVPRQSLNATPYSVTSGSVSGIINGAQIQGGSITSNQLANGAVSANNIANNSITSSQLAPGAAVSNLNSSGQSGVGSGGLILSAAENQTLLSEGYVQVGSTMISDSWQLRANGSPPFVDYSSGRPFWTGAEAIGFTRSGQPGFRYSPSSSAWRSMSINGAPLVDNSFSTVWTGNELIVWASGTNAGSRYNPLSDSWSSIRTNGSPSPRSGQIAVWTGSHMIIWGGVAGTNSLFDGGSYDPFTDSWTSIPSNGVPANAFSTPFGYTWTGTEVLMYGVFSNSSSGTFVGGLRYNPSSNTWATISTNGLTPTATNGFRGSVCVWTGNEMLVWGGNSIFVTNSGARYDPALDSWTTIPSNGGLPTYGFTGVWDGSEMVIYGGTTGGGHGTLFSGAVWRYSPTANSWKAGNNFGLQPFPLAVWSGSEMIAIGIGRSFQPDPGGSLNPLIANYGGRYNPASDSWLAINPAPSPRFQHSAVWTGNQMIVFGGDVYPNYYNDGELFSPSFNAWVPMFFYGTTPAATYPTPRAGHSAVWTGNAMLVWGGVGTNGPVADGKSYQPNSSGIVPSWGSFSGSGEPTPRSGHTGIWTGTEMVVWGGGTNDGGRFQPTNLYTYSGVWNSVPTNGAPSSRYYHSAVWTGNEMIVWGGEINGTTVFKDGARYNPLTGTWRSMNSASAPSKRYNHTAVWTGSKMIVWGGNSGTNYLNDGASYDPIADTWTALPSVALAGRQQHTAVWTGTDMVVWGGDTVSTTTFGDGARYNPTSNTWTPTVTTGAPSGRFFHTSVWTGTEMLVWGGFDGTNALNDTWSYTPGKVLYLYQKL